MDEKHIIVFDQNTQEDVSIAVKKIDKVTLYLRNDARKILDIEYLDEAMENYINAIVEAPDALSGGDLIYNILKIDLGE